MRRFELVEGTSAKFWEIEVERKTVTVRFGRLGTAGQTKDKEHPSAEAAARDAEKLVREKTAKGYAEVGGAKAKAPPAKANAEAPGKTETKASLKANDAPSPVAFPTGKFGWTKEIDALFEKGFPFLRILTDEAVPAKKAIREAKKACQDVDPYLQVHIPREIAVRYLAGYPFEKYTDEASMLAAMAEPPPIDVALLRRVLEIKFPADWGAITETYPFRIAEVLFLFEAFLGPEIVLEESVAHLARARDDVGLWGDDAVDHENSKVALMIAPLGWLRLRMPPARFRELIAPLAGQAPKLPQFVARLRTLLDDDAPVEEHGDLAEIGMQRRNPAMLRERIERFPYWEDPQFYFVLGKDEMLRADVKRLKQQPKWQQLHWLEEFGLVRAPGTARMIAALLESRSVGESARAWLHARRDWVEAEALPALDEADPKAAAAIRATFGGAPVAAPKSKRELETELKFMLDGVGARLKEAKGDKKKEHAVLAETFGHYADIRAALGDISPDAYFTHELGDRVPSWKVDKTTSMRWMDMAVEVPLERA